MKMPEFYGYRYAHCEGHTDFSYSQDGSFILTCGNDGDIRVWEGGCNDDSPESHNVGECTYCIAFHNNNYYVDSGNCAVQAYTYPDHKPNGIITRFTAPVTHLVVSSDGKTMVAGSCDMTIRICNINEFSDKILYGHQAPVLSVALDPEKVFVISSSCDGTVKVWNTKSLKCVKSWDCLPRCNDFSASTVLGRMNWSRDGKILAVPVDGKIIFYEKESWSERKVLTHENLKGASIVEYSSSGYLLGCACNTGRLIIYKMNTYTMLFSLIHKNNYSISAVHWNPKKENEITLCDSQGQLLGCELDLDIEENNVLDEEVLNSLIDDESAVADDDEDDDAVSIGRIKQELGFVDEDGVLEFKRKPIIKEEDDDDSVPGKSIVPVKFTKDDFTEMLESMYNNQNTFQPSATPQNQNHHFMVWNNTGIVICHNSEEENSIDVQFHDSSVHHSIHLNSTGYQIGSLSKEALALACDDSDGPSKLSCYYFSSWDNNKDWIYEMPENESILSLAVGLHFIAVATTRHFLRVFTLAGLQKGIFLLPGTIISITANENQLFVVYQYNKDSFREQQLSWSIYEIENELVLLYSSQSPIPLSPGATLFWFGFSDEGTPCIEDSTGLLSLFDKKSSCWIPLCDTAIYAKGKSNFCFIVGVSESMQNLRCIVCKGSRYPRTLPFPTISTFSFKVPILNENHELSTLEDLVFRESLFTKTCKILSDKGYDVDEISSSTEKSLKANLMKLFAIACKNGQLAQAAEIGQMMPTSYTVELAIKYASKLRLSILVTKLQEVLEMKCNLSKSFDSPESQISSHAAIDHVQETSHVDASQDSEVDLFSQRTEKNPFLYVKTSNSDSKTNEVTNKIEAKNPFKKSSMALKNSGIRGSSALDELKKTDLKNSNITTYSSSNKSKSDFAEWFKENKTALIEKNPGATDHELSIKAMKTYKQVKRKVSDDKPEIANKVKKVSEKLNSFTYSVK